MWKKSLMLTVLLVFVSLALGVCDPEATEPSPVSLPVVADNTHIEPCTNAQGWTITVTALRVALENLELTIEGETHASLREHLRELAVPTAHAHPGHYAGGEVTGELPGKLLIDFMGGHGESLGAASLLPGNYNGMNLYLRTATAADGLTADDPLVGHTAVIAGTAEKSGTVVQFEALLDVNEGTQVVGGPFALAVDAQTSAKLGLALFTIDPSEKDTLFDGLDFGELDSDGDGAVSIAAGQTAHNLLMKTFIRHDHWGVTVQ
ncbi:MAG: hypothetical protein MUC50_02690 [Myxococcota bacterium]|jgi:hypothetical protein|nr:hypothetical protein [Myxococcota bacterium]